jgi:hypothetical protein
LCTCCRHYPGAAAGCIPRSSHPAVSAFPDSTVVSACTSTFSRFAQRLLTLRPAHSRGHQFVTAIRRLQTFRHLHACSGCFRLERIAGWALHPLESAALSRRTWKADLGLPARDRRGCRRKWFSLPVPLTPTSSPIASFAERLLGATRRSRPHMNFKGSKASSRRVNSRPNACPKF